MIKGSMRGGFSTVELLVALFVGSIFLFAGFQLYILITTSSIEARRDTLAAGLAYDYMKKYSVDTSSLGTSCVVKSLYSSTVTDIPELDGSSISVSLACPFGASSKVYKVISKVTYGDPSRDVTYATYVNLSETLSLEAFDIQEKKKDGLYA